MPRWFVFVLLPLMLTALMTGCVSWSKSVVYEDSRVAELKAQGGALDPALQAVLAGASPTDTLEVIVNFDEALTTNGTLTNAVLGLGAGVIQFKHLPMIAALATPAQIAAIQTLPGVQSIYLNRPLRRYLGDTRQGTVSGQLFESIPTIRADEVHALGITGQGVGVAILDTGIDGLHPDLAFPTKTVANVKFLANSRDLFTFSGQGIPKVAATLWIEDVANSDTTSGHGTHVAGIAAGTGTASSAGIYTGVAPGANLIGIGAGDAIFIFWALAGFDFILDHRVDFNIQVVNNSWGTEGPFDPGDPINKATQKVHDAGITVVFAAGNSGPDQNTLNPFSVAPWVIGVAAGCKWVRDPTNSAVHCQDPKGRASVLADFSSRGVPGDPLLHPDITAPGVHIVSSRATTGFVLDAVDGPHDANICNISIQHVDSYTCASGTSMAAPHVAGVIALLEEASGGVLTPDQALDILTKSARLLEGFELWEVGAGYLDALAAVKKALRLKK